MPKKKTKKLKPKKSKKVAPKKKTTKKTSPKTTSKSDAAKQYTAKQITVLKGLEPVRRRPGMYIGGTGVDGLHHLIWEVVDNSIDEAMAGFCDSIVVTIYKDNKVTISDNGRGIPVEKHKATKKSALETVMTTLHAGGKFGDGGYKVSGGLHGVGVSVVCALSEWVRAEVRRDGKVYAQEYKRGKPTSKLKVVGKSKDTGTTISFEADPEIFPIIEYNLKKILTHLRQQAYLTRGTKMTIIDERAAIKERPIPSSYSFYFEGGLTSYVKYLIKDQAVVHPTPFYVDKEVNGIFVEVAWQYTQELTGYEIAFANNIYTEEGGTHIVGFRTALTRTLNSYARKNEIVKEKEEALTGDDVREGLTAVVSVKLKNPQFEGQTKAKLGNTEVRSVVNEVVGDAVEAYLEEHPDEARAILGKCLIAAKARKAAKAAKDTVIRKGALDGFALPGKLADCSEKDAKKCELYIVEGDSAGGSAKQGRDRNFQAILPLRGKILNVERARIDRMLSSKEIKALIIALGAGVGEEFDITKLRYDRIIIMTDADVDGAHIRTLLLTFFYRYFTKVITEGHLYIAQPPLFKVQSGSQSEWAYTESEKDEIAERFLKVKKTKKGKSKRKEGTTKAEAHGFETKKVEGEEAEEETGGPKINIQRYKGLGEMNPDQLWDTTMDPDNRIMLKVVLEDAEKADQTFDTLMGDEVDPRRRFIQTHAKNVKNLDI